MQLRIAIGLCCLLVVCPFLHAEETNEMDDPIRRYEETSASEYDNVETNGPSMLNKRDTNKKMIAKQKSLDFSFDETDAAITDDTPVFFARPDGRKIIYEEINDALKEMQKSHTNRKRRASEAAGSGGTGNGKDDAVKSEFIKDFHRGTRAAAASKEHVVHVPILVLVDSSYRDEWSNNKISSFMEYVTAFWNDVNRIYHKIAHPRVKVHVIGIVIGTHPAATPFIMREMTDKDTFEFEDALHELGKFAFELGASLSLPTYGDSAVVVTMTKFKLGHGKSQTTLGIAHDGGACQSFELRKYHCGIALVNDNGEFSGVFTAAHEVMHVLGLKHDTEKLPAECSPKHGFLMTELKIVTTKTSTLSPCSERALKEAFEEGNLDCMKNPPPTKGAKLPRFAAAEIADFTGQCKQLGKGPWCTPSDVSHNVCGELYCLENDKGGKCVSTKKPANPGSPCMNPKERILGYCVPQMCVSY